MRARFVLLVLSLSAILFNGCQDNTAIDSGVEVIVDGDGQFPPFLVGTWKANQGGWEIVFEPDGKISSALVSLGQVKMVPGKVTTVPMEMGGKGTFTPGLWSVQYLQQPRRLIVEIAIENFHVELAEDIVRGSTRDFFVGEVSRDGTSWWAQRFSYPEYTVDTDKFPDYKLPVDPNENPRESLLFQKVPPKK